MRFSYARLDLPLCFEARTSRGSMTSKETFLIRIDDPETGREGIGECALFRGLSSEDTPDYEERLADLCRSLNRGEQTADISKISSLRFGLECATLDFDNGGRGILFPSDFTEGRRSVPTNGLVWMDSIEHMTEQAEEKIRQGFRCIKFKIGQHDFNRELEMIDKFRLRFGPDRLEIRLDANGAYDVEEALANLRRIEPLDIHSVEQPIKAGRWDRMAYICENSPQAVALDEELIGVTDPAEMAKMLKYIAPKYIVLKPSLCGGLTGASKWIELAAQNDIGWWITSALESNVGLNALAQWAGALQVDTCQGLGTGALYTRIFPSPLRLARGMMSYDPAARLIVDSVRWILPE
ncbi:MAG: o-succinylbenzoate synthase [Clostridium sp.]|nr:o-succinylbenzoate synthase [Clostridium sp.]